MTFDFTISIPIILTIATLFATGMWRIFSLTNKANMALRNSLETKEKLADLKLELAKDYPSNSYLQQVEDRLTKAIEGLGDEIRQLRSYIMNK